MKREHIYLLLCIPGTILPYAVFIPWLAAHGLNISLLIREIAASPVATFGWLDVLVSAITLFVLILSERHGRNWKLIWLPILGTLLAGVSLGLPLYLYLREGEKVG